MNENKMEYKGYETKIYFNAEDKVLYGQIENIKDVVFFHSKSAREIENSFHKAVDNYLCTCEKVEKIHESKYLKKSYLTTFALNIAKYIVNKCIKDKCPITNFQLQYILYCIQKEYLKMGKLAFYDNIEAWQFGPVVPNVYYEFCTFGAMYITLPIKEEKLFNLEDRKIINRIVEDKREWEIWDWGEFKEKSAWNKVYQNGAGLNKIIHIELIKEEKD